MAIGAGDHFEISGALKEKKVMAAVLLDMIAKRGLINSHGGFFNTAVDPDTGFVKYAGDWGCYKLLAGLEDTEKDRVH